VNRKTFWTIVAAISYVALTACSSNGKKANTDVIAPTSGGGQSTTVGTAFGMPLVATVTTGGAAASGVMVTFTAPGSGASGTFANGTATETDMTNSSGVATSSTFTANTTAGAYMVMASAPNAQSVTYNMTNTAGPAAGLTVASGNNQSATVSTAYANPLAVQVVDSHGNPVSDAGLNVTFAAPGSGASGTFGNGTATETDMTNASGVATSSTFKANATTGGYTVTASATISGAKQTANFSLTNAAVMPAGLSAASGSGQSAIINMAFGKPLAAQVVDSHGNPVSDAGVSVTFTAPGSGASGTFANGTATETDMTNAGGLATSSTFKANGTTGGYMVAASATINGGTQAANFSLTNTAGPAAGLSASSGSGQSATVSTAFSKPLEAQVVDSKGNPVSDSGVSVTFMAPGSGASGTFANGTATETDMTNATGLATSSTFKANGTAGGYTVAASATINGGTQTANFSLTNTASTSTTQNFVFYLYGSEGNASNGNYNLLSLAGAVTINLKTGAVTGGVQDYNDGYGVTSPQPNGDTITGGQLTLNASGQGTLTLITNNSKVGSSGTETLGVQFVNTDHALVMQFDGTATSSGSMDLQTLPSPLAPPSGKFAFTLSGVDTGYYPIAAGGVLSISGNTLAGTLDVNDAGTTVQDTAFSGNISTPGSFGRGNIKDTGIAIVINYYIIGPEAVRLIDVDTDATAVGSSYGQGDTTFTNASVPSPAVFELAGNSFSGIQGNGGNDAVGQFTTSATSSSPSNFSGVADINEFGNGVTPLHRTPIGTYSLSNTTNGYGSMTFSVGNLGDAEALGLYMTDPNLNLNDPNSSSGGGGALVLVLGTELSGVTGVLSPQTDPSSNDFKGNYAVSWQNINSFNACTFCEFDLVGQQTVTGGSISGTGLISDPFNTLTANRTPSGVTFSGTPPPDGSNPGRYGTFPLKLTIAGVSGDFNLVMYQASGGLLYWLEMDNNATLVGPLEQQGSLTGLPAVAAAPEAAPTKQ
jgi:hypothetical protein